MIKVIHNCVMANRSGDDWMHWFGAVSSQIPELRRAFEFLDGGCMLLSHCADGNAKILSLQLRQLINRFMGSSRCPSVQLCEKIAIRTRVFNGWMQSEIKRVSDPLLLMDLGAYGLQKLLIICEGADDKQGILLRAVREFARNWLSMACSHIENLRARAHLIYPVAMLDQTGLIEPDWWWRQLALCDRSTVQGLVELEIRDMVEMQPSNTVSLRSFDKRWRRLRLRSLLEYLDDKVLLAELMRKSAVDDLEAALAVRLLRQAGRFRDAMNQAEQWMRALPRSRQLAEALFDLYVDDGCDQEAFILASTHYDYDHQPIWIDRLGKLTSRLTQSKIKNWKKQHLNSSD